MYILAENLAFKSAGNKEDTITILNVIIKHINNGIFHIEIINIFNLCVQDIE